MKGIKYSLIIILFVPVCISAQQNQYSIIDSLAAKTVEKLRSHFSEKILMNTDKQIYVAGETIWFKAFLTDSLSGKLTDKSRILYADFVNDKDSVINQMVFDAGKLETGGRIILDHSLPSGYYWLRAYTKALIAENKNDIGLLPVYVFNKNNNQLQQVQSIKTETRLAQNSKPQIDIFPEGGQLISGIDCIVALKIHDANGEPLKLSGIIKSTRNVVVSKFETNNRGLAKFSIEPKWYEKYSVWIENNGSYDSVTNLPKVNLYAAQISVQQQDGQFLKTRVMLDDSIFTKTYTTYILGLHGDSICFASIGHGNYELNIPVSGFPEGIANILLFNEEKQLVSERSVYIQKKNVNISIISAKENYNAREEAKLDINVTDASGKPAMANLAVSVTDLSILDTAALFSKDEFVNKQADEVDLTMLVRKFNLPGTPAFEDAKIYGDSVITLSGMVTDKNQYSVSNVQVTLMATHGTSMILQDTTNAAGKFSFNLPAFSDSTKFSLQTTDMKGRKIQYNITTDPFNFPKVKTPELAKKRFQPQQNQLLKFIRQKGVDSVLIKFGEGWLIPVKVKTQKDNDAVKPKNVITQEMLLKGGFNDVGLAVLANGKFHLINGYLIEGGPNNQNGVSANDEPLIVVDGQVIQTSSDGITGSPVLSYLKTMNAADIDYIKILSGFEAGIYGVRGGHGVLEIHSAKTFNNGSSGGDIKEFSLKGFQLPSVFPAPDYTNKKTRNSKTPDLRNVIYWNGNVFTDKNGNASVNFFTADPSTTYLVTVTGITANGFTIFKTSVINRN